MQTWIPLIRFMPLFILWLTSSAAAADEPLRVMSFNIRYGTADDGLDSWPNRKSFVADLIREFRPDLLGTQETLPLQAEFLAEQLPGYHRLGWSRDPSEHGEQCTLFVRSDRFDVDESGQFWLSETPDAKYSRGWDAALPRVATWARISDRLSGQTLLFMNTHFDHRGESARRESAGVIRSRIRDLAKDDPVILTGDFNCAESSEAWKTLTADQGLRDTWRTVFPDVQPSEGTFHGFRGQPGPDRIDWILASEQLNIMEASIDRSSRDHRFPSDHFPVTSVLSFRRN